MMVEKKEIQMLLQNNTVMHDACTILLLEMKELFDDDDEYI